MLIYVKLFTFNAILVKRFIKIYWNIIFYY